MAVGDFNNTENKTLSTEFSYDEDGNIIIKEPVIPDSYCSHKGITQIVLNTMACYCLGDAVGKYCHLKGSDYTNLESMYELFLNKAENTYKRYIQNLTLTNTNNEEEYAFLSSLNNLILGNQLYAKDGTFTTELTVWLDRNVIKNVNRCDLKYIEMVDNIFSTMILLTNTYKAGLISNHKGTNRDADLNMGQEEEIDSNMIYIKKHLEYLTKLCFSDTEDGLWTYTSDNIHVNLLKIPKNSDINIDEKIKSLKIGKHEPYFQFGDCINSVKSADNSQYINIQSITWIYSPWYHHHTLNYNYTSNYVEVKLYSDDLKELHVSECKNGHITFYLNLINSNLADIINNNKFHFKEGNIFKSDNPIFTEPKYILDDGSISNMTLQERRDKYYFQYLLVFKTMDEGNRELVKDGIEYKNLEEDSYLKCTSNHLSEFLLNYEYNPVPNKVLGRFYFLNHMKLYSNTINLKGNYGFYSIIIVIALYFLNFAIVKILLTIKKKKLGNKNYLLIEDFLVYYVYPYGNIEGDFFVNKENMNKIYNKNLNIKSEKSDNKSNDILQLKEKNNDAETKMSKKMTNKEKLRKEAYLNDNNFLNYGDIKNKRLYDQYYQAINEDGYNEESEEVEEEQKSKKIKGRNKKNIKETNTNVISTREEMNVKKKKVEKRKKIKK